MIVISLKDSLIGEIQSQKIHELKIAEDFSEFIGTNVDDSEINIDNTETVVYNYIDSVQTDLDKNRIKRDIFFDDRGTESWKYNEQVAWR